jgi:hypothetical protein
MWDGLAIPSQKSDWMANRPTAKSGGCLVAAPERSTKGHFLPRRAEALIFHWP